MALIPEPSEERPWLVADVGGTHARFGLISRPGGSPEAVAVLRGAEHEGLPDAVAAYLGQAEGGVRPGAACLAIAGPVEGDRYHLTNASWHGSIRDLGLPHSYVLNDFEALALSLPYLAEDDLLPLGGPPAGGGPGGAVTGAGSLSDGARDLPGDTGVGGADGGRAGMVKAVLGPGTGLGVAGLVPAGDRWVAVPAEGGHVSAPVVTDLEVEIVRALRADGMPYVDAEHLISGPGLTRLHHGLALVHGLKVASPPAARIVADQDDPLCVQTVEVFCGLLGGFAGDVALTLGARGGVYLGGGVLTHLADRLPSSDFRRRFTGNPALARYLAAIATSLIVAGQPALTGAAAWLAQRSAPARVAPGRVASPAAPTGRL